MHCMMFKLFVDLLQILLERASEVFDANQDLAGQSFNLGVFVLIVSHSSISSEGTHFEELSKEF
jgi:hypothetical protein